MVTWFQLLTALKKYKPRSAWDKGVRWYAIQFVKRTVDGWERTDWSANIPDIYDFERKCLGGAKDWRSYSKRGMGGQIATIKIAKRLCTPSELKKLRGKEGAKWGYGEWYRDPNPYEDWCDVEGRALKQAFDLIKSTYRALKG